MFFAAPFAALVAQAFGTGGTALPWRALGFTVVQAFASSLLATVAGLPGAFLLARRSFPGRGLLSATTAVPLCVPPVVMGLGFVMLFGREGFANVACDALFGLRPFRFLYTPSGLVIVHAAYNAPLVFRVVGDAWAALPGTQEEAARTLGAGKARVFLSVTLPQLLPSIGAAATLVFLYSYFSFVIAMLVGGIGASTLEVELYRAARIGLDRAGAARIALLETSVALAFVFAYAKLGAYGSAPRREFGRGKPTRRGLSLAEALPVVPYLLVAALFTVGPIVAIAVRSFVERSGFSSALSWGIGNYAKLGSSSGFAPALGLTLAASLIAALLAAAACLAFLSTSRGARRGGFAALVSTLPLAVSGTALALGWSRIGNAASGVRIPTFLVIAVVVASSAFPLILRPASAALSALPREVFDAARTLGAGVVERAGRLVAPSVARPLVSGAVMVFAVAAGDANAALMLGSGAETLALRVYRYVGSYRFGEACALATLIFAVSACAFAAFGRDGDVR